MDTKTCSMCNFEKRINNFYRFYPDCRDCKRARGLKRYYKKEDEISNQNILSSK